MANRKDAAGPLLDDPELDQLWARRQVLYSQLPTARPSQPPRPAPTRWTWVELAAVTDHLDLTAGKIGVQVQLRVTADDDEALWRFFGVRANQFEERLRATIREVGGGKLEVKDVEYRRGSLTIVMLIVAVVAQYPQIKQNFPIIASDAAELIEWIRSEIIPEVKRRVTNYFEEYREVPLVRLAKSIWNALFG